VPFDCRFRSLHGQDACLHRCPTHERPGLYQYVRIEESGVHPPPDRHAIDVAILDMHHGWPNLGHDAIVHAVQNIACDLLDALEPLELRIRAISYDVRRGHAIPLPPGEGRAIYVGTGGPGHLDPRLNDGLAPESQGICENPEWEPRLYDLFDRIRADWEAALLGVCHTFGVMCRWLGVASPVLRSAEKGGKSAGVLENALTEEALHHPWFHRFATMLPDGRRLRVLESRLFDLVPVEQPLPPGLLAVGYETLGVGGPVGDGLTMLEVERDATGCMPRVFGVNHHPEIVNRDRQLTILRRRLAQGEVTRAWYDERERALTQTMLDEDSDFRLRLTSSYTLMAPLRYFIYRQVRLRAEASGRETPVHEALAPLEADEVAFGPTAGEGRR
jgi:hypothetical protein